MTTDEVMRAARSVVEAHIRAINAGDEEGMKSQLVGSKLERPFRIYCENMALLRPLSILSVQVDEPERRTTPPFPRMCVYVTVQLASGAQRERVELPVWVLEEDGRALIASRIRMRKKTSQK